MKTRERGSRCLRVPLILSSATYRVRIYGDERGRVVVFYVFIYSRGDLPEARGIAITSSSGAMEGEGHLKVKVTQKLRSLKCEGHSRVKVTRRLRSLKGEGHSRVKILKGEGHSKVKVTQGQRLMIFRDWLITGALWVGNISVVR